MSRNQKRKLNRQNKKNQKPYVAKTMKGNFNPPAKKKVIENKSKTRTVTRVNQNNQRNNALVQFVHGSLEFAPVIMPRPVPMPTASYVFQKTLEFNSAPLDANYEGVIEISPYLDSQIIVSTDDYDKDNSSYIDTSYVADGVVVSTYYAKDHADALNAGSPVVLVPPLANHTEPGVIAKYWSAVVTGWAQAFPSVYAYVPNYRDLSQLDFVKGATPYFNVTAKANQPEMKYILSVDGLFAATPQLQLIEFSKPDIDGLVLATTNFDLSGDPRSHSVVFSLTHTFADATESVVFVLRNASMISLLRWADGGRNADNHTMTIKVNNHRRIFSIFPLHEEKVFKEIIEASSGYAITGLAATITNTSPPQYQGGTSIAALLPSEVQTPLHYSGLYQVVAERPYYRYLGLARTGAHAVWVPETIGDLAMMHKSRYLQSNRLMLGFSSVPSQGATSSWKLVVSWRVEFQVNSMILPSRIAPCSTDFLPTLFAGIREHLDYLYGENPSHRQRIKEVVKKIAKNPQLRSIAKQLGSAAMQALSTAAVKGLAAL